MKRDQEERLIWDQAFKEASRVKAINLAPAEPIVRTVAYYLRSRFADGNYSHLDFLEMGCGAGPHLRWLAGQGITVHGVDISSVALDLCRHVLEASGYTNCLGQLIEGSVCDIALKDNCMDGIIESNVFQHLNKTERKMAFSEVTRLLKPGGVFVGYMFSSEHEIYISRKNEQQIDDPGTLLLDDGGPAYHMNNLGLSHFFSEQEIREYLSDFGNVDLLEVIYDIPTEEAKRRGFDSFRQSMWNVYAVK